MLFHFILLLLLSDDFVTSTATNAKKSAAVIKPDDEITVTLDPVQVAPSTPKRPKKERNEAPNTEEQAEVENNDYGSESITVLKGLVCIPLLF